MPNGGDGGASKGGIGAGRGAEGATEPGDSWLIFFFRTWAKESRGAAAGGGEGPPTEDALASGGAPGVQEAAAALRPEEGATCMVG